jgi:deoxyribodipyrimidine photolyase-related protein
MNREPEGEPFRSRPLSSLRGRVERLLLLLPDQLHAGYLEAAELDPAADALLQMELVEDFNYVPSHKQRTALFLSAMRHFALEAERAGWRGAYVRLEDRRNDGSLRQQLQRAWKRLRPARLVVFRPGDFRTLQALQETTNALGAEIELLEDPHFLVEPADFDGWAAGRKALVMEHFYRWMRRRLEVLLTSDGKPAGGSWNYDPANRKTLGKDAPDLPRRLDFAPDAITRDVLELVERRFADAPGRLRSFAWPVTRTQARRALRHFIRYHPRECVRAAERACSRGAAPLNAVEGFIRQIIGWREFIRGVYWREGPDYTCRNHLSQTGRLPDFYWTGETDLKCLEEAVAQVLEHGYGHHIQRLMVTGNLALVSGVEPRQISDWYLGMYVDAMEWVTLPNTAGMVMYADGGVVGSKPYAASGRYIDRMSDYCDGCRFSPGERTGDRACPVTTFYWDFLARNRQRLARVRRMRFALNNLERIGEAELREIRRHAKALRRQWGREPLTSPAGG